MQIRFAVPLLAALAISAPALAQNAPAPQRMKPSPEMMAKFHDRMCTDHYAHAVGGLAALEVELKLTPAQKPLFERWKDVKLASAKAASAKCADMKIPPDRNVSIVEFHKHQIAMLETRLADLKAETPALDALVNALDEDQQTVLRHAGMRAMHDHMGMMGRFMDHRMGRRMDQRGGPMMGRPMGDMPPPPAN